MWHFGSEFLSFVITIALQCHFWRMNITIPVKISNFYSIGLLKLLISSKIHMEILVYIFILENGPDLKTFIPSLLTSSLFATSSLFLFSHSNSNLHHLQKRSAFQWNFDSLYMSEMKKSISQVHLTRRKELLLQKVTQKNKKYRLKQM